MRNHLLSLTLLASLGATSGCTDVECGDGTIERDGVCEPATNGGPTPCGPNTVFVGDQCLPKYEPTVCDPTTEAQFDPNTGVTTCVGGGVLSCEFALPCPVPTGNTKQTICGQLYDVETGMKFQGAATGNKCDFAAPTSSGPCALRLLAFDALKYAADQTMGNVTPTGSSDVLIDDCGRYRVSNIETSGTGPYLGVGFFEAGKAPQSPLANLTVTATTGVATPRLGHSATDKLEAIIAKPSTVTSWQTTSGSMVNFANGIYVGSFREHKLGNGDQFAKQAGVTVTRSGSTIPGSDFYSPAAATTVTAIDNAATATGMNGAAWINGGIASQGPIYAGNGGLGSTHCQWESHAGANIANIVFYQVFRKTDVTLDPTPCAD